jgi:hypothetical protein
MTFNEGLEQVETPFTPIVSVWEIDIRAPLIYYGRGVHFRFMWVDASNYYTLYLSRSSSGTNYMMLQKTVAGTPTNLIIANPSHTTNFHTYKITRDGSGNFEIFRDDVSQGSINDTAITTSNKMQLVEMYNVAETIDFDNLMVRKYAANPPTYTFGSEEVASYMPPNPITLINTIGNFWVNHTWSVGSGNATDSYNVSVNNIWYNTTTDTFYNDTYTAHAWQNISVYAFNTSGVGTLSTGSINQNTQIPNNPITITNTSDWSGDAGETVYVDYDATDIDSDTATFSCDRIDLFTDFDTSTGTGNWTATANIYYVDFGVSDGYGSISNYTMTLTESSVEITLLDETKLIMSEITAGLKGVNMSNYLVYAFILIGILLIILGIQIIINNIYRG